MKKSTMFLGAIAMIATTPAPAQMRGDEPVAVPRAVRQGIDFVYVDPQMSSVATKLSASPPEGVALWSCRRIFEC